MLLGKHFYDRNTFFGECVRVCVCVCAGKQVTKMADKKIAFGSGVQRVRLLSSPRLQSATGRPSLWESSVQISFTGNT